MAKSIPGPVWLIIGLVMGIISFFINKKSFAFNSAYAIFLYISLILIFYGFVKILIFYMVRPSDEEKKELKNNSQSNNQNNFNQTTQNNFNQTQQPFDNQNNLNPNFNQQQNNFQNQNVQNNSNQQQGQNYIFYNQGDDEDRYRFISKCKNCGLTSYAAYANFCQNCGNKLR